MFEDFSIDSVKDDFNSVKSSVGEAIDDLTAFKKEAVDSLSGVMDKVDEVHDTVDGFIDSTRDTIHDLGDPFGIVDGFVDGYLDMAEGYVNDAFGIVDQLFSRVKPTAYQKIAKQYVSKMVTVPFRQGWQWTIEADGTPPDFDIYVKDIDMGIGSVDADTQNIGSGSIAKPTSAAVSEITMTVRDHEDGRIAKWFAKKLGKVRNKDGTVNLPCDYVFSVRLLSVDNDGKKHPWKEYRVFPTNINLALNYESQGEFISYSITLQKFSNLGNKFL